MKRFIVLAAVAGLLVGSLAAPADAQKKQKKKKGPTRTERTVEGDYLTPSLVVVGGCAPSGAIGCVVLPSAAGEGFVTASVSDAHGQPVFVSILSDSDGDTMDETIHGVFCGETPRPLPIPEGVELHFWIGITPTSTDITGCPPATGTMGTVTATFSNLP